MYRPTIDQDVLESNIILIFHIWTKINVGVIISDKNLIIFYCILKYFRISLTIF